MPSSVILHLDQPRSGGHLLQRILSDQPKRSFLDHPFAQARGLQVQWLTSTGPVDDMGDALRRQFDEEIEKGIAKWSIAVADADDAGSTLIVQDHCFNCAPPEVVKQVLEIIDAGDARAELGLNVLQPVPESLYLQDNTIPLFTIREPRLSVPSAYRVLAKFGLPHGGGRATFSVTTNPIWIRLLYRLYTSHGITPVVVDCDDVQTAASTDFLQRLCVQLGLDPHAVRLTWPRISEAERSAAHPMFYASQSTLLESDGVDARLAACNRDLKAEERAWEGEFGSDVGLVREMVERAMPHYRWLSERAFR